MRIHKVSRIRSGASNRTIIEEELNRLERSYRGLRIESIFPLNHDQFFYVVFSYLEEKPTE